MTSASGILQARMTSHVDFPQPGIVFRDITPVLADGPSLRVVVDEMLASFAGQFDAVAGLEARGFIFAAAAARAAGVGVIPVRKAGKLPGPVLRESFQLEYGEATFEVNPEWLESGSRVLIMDDVLATGGTARAAVSLIEQADWNVVGVSVALELADLNGREQLGDHRVHSLLAL